MTNKIHGYRMTEFRKSSLRRRRLRRLLRTAAIGCGLAGLVAGVWLIRMDTAKAEQCRAVEGGDGTIDNPYLVEAPDSGPSQAEEQTLLQGVSRREFEYLGELEVAAYSSSEGEMTYSGELPVDGRTAAGALSVFQIGDAVLIDGKPYVIEDKVNEEAGEKLRIYFEGWEEAREFGRRDCSVYRRAAAPEEGPDYLGEFQVTGYCGCPLCCGEKEEVLTKMETVPRAGHTVAADPSVIPLGTEIVIDGVVYLVEDTGKAVKGKTLDIFFDTHEEAVQYGRKDKYVYLKE
ncbi:MAG: hypothetical protein KH230_07010 [Enterocloster asparagiformis]|nr:hypothetical protein [Enterocloster asparagiformis]